MPERASVSANASIICREPAKPCATTTSGAPSASGR